MRHPTFILISALLLVLFVGVGGLWVWDASREDTIAKGTTVNGVSLGGMKPEEARIKLQRSVMLSMQKPIVIKEGRTKWRLSSQRARVTVNVDSMVQEALDKSRRGNLFSRTWRTLTGDDAHANITPTITYSQRVVNKLVGRIAAKTDQPVIEARVVPSPTDLGEVNGQDGQKLRRRALTNAIEKEPVNPSADRVIKSEASSGAEDDTRTWRTSTRHSSRSPRRSQAALLEEPQAREDLQRRRRAAGVADVGRDVPGPEQAGRPGLVGPQRVLGREPGGSGHPGRPQNPLKARWIGFNGGQGFHGTSEVDSLGTAASHGCVRMDVNDVEALYPRVALGAPLYIV